MAVWPSLPISLDSYSETIPDRVIRSSMEVGPQKIRRRSSTAVRKVAFKMMLTDAQVATFDAFFDTNDSLAFDFTDPRTSVLKRARFAGVSKYDRDETMWTVTVELEYLP